MVGMIVRGFGYLLGMLVGLIIILIIGIATASVHDELKYNPKGLIDECERDLPRVHHCILKAIPDQRPPQ